MAVRKASQGRSPNVIENLPMRSNGHQIATRDTHFFVAQKLIEDLSAAGVQEFNLMRLANAAAVSRMIIDRANYSCAAKHQS
jgi:hypothetical protein